MDVIDKIVGAFGVGPKDDEIDEIAEDYVEEKQAPTRRNKKDQDEQHRQEVSHSVSAKGDLSLVEPTAISDAKIICDELRDGKTVVVNLKNISTEEANRLLDFVQGSVYALDGKIKRISIEVVVVAPKGIDIKTNQVDLDQDYVEDEDDELEYGY